MISKDTVRRYEEGVLTLYGVYEECEDDLEMYDFLANYLYMDEDEIKENMEDVSGANDAYYNALSQMEYEEDETIPLERVKLARTEIQNINPIYSTSGDGTSVFKNCDDIITEVLEILNKLIEER